VLLISKEGIDKKERKSSDIEQHKCIKGLSFHLKASVETKFLYPSFWEEVGYKDGC